MSKSAFAPLVCTAIQISEVEEGAYTDGYASGNENGYTSGWYDARELAEKEQAVLEARIELLEFQLSAIK